MPTEAEIEERIRNARAAGVEEGVEKGAIITKLDHLAVSIAKMQEMLLSIQQANAADRSRVTALTARAEENTRDINMINQRQAQTSAATSKQLERLDERIHDMRVTMARYGVAIAFISSAASMAAPYLLDMVLR